MVIGLTGSFASGCGTAAAFLKEQGYETYSLSKWLKEICEKRGLKIIRRNLQDIGDELREDYPSEHAGKKRYDYLVRVCIAEMFSKEKLCDTNITQGNFAQAHQGIDELKKIINQKQNIIVRSIRNKGEVDTLREVFDNFYLFAIDTETTSREYRVLQDKTSDREYENPEYFEIDDARDAGKESKEPYSGQQVRECVKQADIIITNNQTPEELKKMVNSYNFLITNPKKMEANDENKFMLDAIKVSKMSKCLKRGVGAILVDQETGKCLGKGFNSAPQDKNLCFDLGKCQRDEMRLCANSKCNKKLQMIMDKCWCCERPVPKMQKQALEKNIDLCIAVHAEERAIFNAFKSGNYQDTNKYTLYSTTFPCQICARTIAEVGIDKLVYIDPYPYLAAQRILRSAKVKYTKFEGVIREETFEHLFR